MADYFRAGLPLLLPVFSILYNYFKINTIIKK